MRRHTEATASLRVQVDDQGVHIGASVTLSRLMDTCKQLSAQLPSHQVGAQPALACPPLHCLPLHCHAISCIYPDLCCVCLALHVAAAGLQHVA